MKVCLPALLIGLTCLTCFAADPSEDAEKLIKQLKNCTRIGTVNDNIVRNDSDEKILVLKFHTNQDKRHQSKYRMRITVEAVDKEGNLYCGQSVTAQGGRPSDYTGEDDWEFQCSLAELEKPKVSAYVIEYGFMDGTTFVPLTEELKHAETAAEILDRSKKQLSIQCTKNSYWYRGE
jgi:hypothetical protein